MNRPIKFLLDQSPRRLYYFLRGKLNKRNPLQSFTDEFPCVFVLSTGRVGTETVDALFGLSDNVFSYHEPLPTLYGLSKLSYQNSGDSVAREILMEAFLTSRRDLLKYSLDCQRGFVETSPQVTFLAPVILNALLDARFIHLVRDPRSVIRSGMRRKWFDGHPNDGTRITPLSGTQHAANWSRYDVFQKNAWLWNETNRWILEFTNTLPAGRVLTIRSEDIFSGRSDSLRALYQFIGSSIPPASRITGLLKKKLNAQQSGDFPNWAHWSDTQITDMINVVRETSEKLGYDILKDNE